MSKYSGILAMGKKHYPSLVFDFSQLSNVDDYYREYCIPAEEKPMVYAYSGNFFAFRLEGSGTLITDKAIYFHPSHKDWARDNRLPLSKICSYVVFQENERDNVSLISGVDERRIFGKTVAPNDTTGSELVELLKALQQALITGSKEKKEFERTLGYVLALIRESFRSNGLLDGRYKVLLDQISEYPRFSTEVAFIRAEHYYRLCDKEGYYHFIKSLGDEVDRDVLKSLNKPDDIFFDRYIKHIASSSTFYMTRSLIDPYLNLKREERLSLKQCIILCFLCIRLDDDDYYDAIFEMIRSHLDTDDFWKLSSLRANMRNSKMSGVYDLLLSKSILKDQDLEQKDALGLSPLHYALIMRDKSLVRQLLSQRDWMDYRPPVFTDTSISTVYDFVFAASCLFDDVSLISDIMLATRADAKPLARTIHQLNTSIDVHTSLLSRAMSSGDLEEIRYRREQIEEFRQMKSEVSEEILRLTTDEITRSRKAAESFITDPPPIVSYIMHLYLTPDALYRSIADTISSWRIYRCQDVFFATSLEHILKLSYYEWKNGQITARYIIESDLIKGSDSGDQKETCFDGDTFINPNRVRKEESNQEKRRQAEEERRRRRKRFRAHSAASGDGTLKNGSFFSPQAHSNIRILKQEYRRLVKRYHPDAGGSARDVEIMLMIMNERADILERLQK